VTSSDFISKASQHFNIQKVEKLAGQDQLVISTTSKLNKEKYTSLTKELASIADLRYSLVLSKSYAMIPTGDILLQPKKGISISTILHFVQGKAALTTQTEYNTFVLKIKDIAQTLSVANKIYESGLVDWCHPDFLAEIIKLQNDPLYAQQYYLNNTGQLNGVAGIDINAPEAWAISRGINNVRVAVIDDGVEAHEDLAGRVLPGFTPRNPNGFGAPIANPPGTLVGHGQACAGIIGATIDNTLGVAGIAPCTQIVPINIFSDWFINAQGRVSYRETAQDLAAGINWAWNNGQADILSNSWGYGTTNGGDIPNFDAIVQAINNARTQGRGGRGSIVIFASGNSAQLFQGVTFPANVAGVITVGAVNNRGDLWNYSSRGAEMDLVAPSGDVNFNGDLRTTDRMNANGYEPGNYTPRFGGTSAACPQVSGVAALMISANPNLTEANLANILRNTATDMGAGGFDNDFGFGRLNAQAALQAVFPTINGPAVVCTSANYTVSNLPAGATVTWSSSNSNLTINAAGNANRLNNFNGSATVTATIAGGCGNSQMTLNVTVGGPFYQTGSSTLCNSRTSSVFFYSPVSLTWQVLDSFNDIVDGGVGTSFTVYGGQLGVGNFKVRAGMTSCTPISNWKQTNIKVNNCGSSASVMLNAYPNPSTNLLTIQVTDSLLSDQSSSSKLDEPYQLDIINKFQQKVFSSQFTDKKVQIQTGGFAPDVYFLIVQYKEAVMRRHIIIKR
jgi:serine protease